MAADVGASRPEVLAPAAQAAAAAAAAQAAAPAARAGSAHSSVAGGSVSSKRPSDAGDHPAAEAQPSPQTEHEVTSEPQQQPAAEAAKAASLRAASRSSVKSDAASSAAQARSAKEAPLETKSAASSVAQPQSVKEAPPEAKSAASSAAHSRSVKEAPLEAKSAASSAAQAKSVKEAPLEAHSAKSSSSSSSKAAATAAVAPAAAAPAAGASAAAGATVAASGPSAAGGQAPAAAVERAAPPASAEITAETPAAAAAAGAAAGATPRAAGGTQPTAEAAAADASAAAPATPSARLSFKTLPSVASGAAKVVADAGKQAGQSYVNAGKEAKGTAQLLAQLASKGPVITVTLEQILLLLFFIVVGFNLLFLPIFMPNIFRLVYCIVWGLLAGLGLSFGYFYNLKRKREINSLLSTNLGLKGVMLVAGGLPSWVNMSQKEKMEWFNTLVLEVWPYIDKGVCGMIKDITAQVMPGVLKSLPAGLNGIVKSINFKHLTFGAAPFRVESIWVSPNEKERLLMEVSVKWCGDPNITLAIEIPGGTKLCPRVMDISFVATIRIVLQPLVPRIPGFVGAMATVPKPPLIKYRLDFGKAMGGSLAPAAVTPVVNFFMREIITMMLVWPQRIVVPILQETEQDKVEIQKLMRRHQGVLRINVVTAKELKPHDWAGTNDVVLECTTDPARPEATTMRRAVPTGPLDAKGRPSREQQTVVWNEYIYLLVQEPRDQMLRIEVFDMDGLRPQNLLKGQVTQIVNSRNLIGRSLVKLRDVTRAGEEGSSDPIPYRAHLGEGQWGDAGGPGKGAGKVLLNMTYWPFENLTKYDVENAMMGIVTIRLLKVWGLAAAGDSLTAFVRATTTAPDNPPWRSTARTWTRYWHLMRLKRELVALKVGYNNDVLQGRAREANRRSRYFLGLAKVLGLDFDITAHKVDTEKQREAYFKLVNRAVDKKNRDKPARLVADMDYLLDANAMHAMYHVKLTDMVKIKVLSGSLLAGTECLGRLDIPVSDIVTANDFNPMTGRREFGLHRKRWEEYDPLHPEREVSMLERGLLLDEGDGARIWMELRWVPCVQATGAAPAVDDETQTGALPDGAASGEIPTVRSAPPSGRVSVAGSATNSGKA